MTDCINFSSGSYRIVKRLFKTKGSRNQIITEDPNHPNLETMTVFYIVEKNVNKYWVKKNSVDRIENTIAEWNRGREYYDVIEYNGNTIGLVKLLERSDNFILMEYLDGYVNINKIASFDKQIVKSLFLRFMNNTKMIEYDFNVNNIMLKVDRDNNVHIRFVDFDVSPFKLLERGRTFLNELE